MNDLEKLRQEIDKLDEELLQILAKRFAVVKKIGTHKKEVGQVVLDSKRWEKVMESGLTKAKLLELPVELIKDLYELIHSHSLKIENEVKS
jgi:chorismate mutase